MSWVSFLSGSVDDIIDHYKKEQIVEGYNLKEAVSVQVSSYMLTSYSEPHCIFDLAKWHSTVCFLFCFFCVCESLKILGLSICATLERQCTNFFLRCHFVDIWGEVLELKWMQGGGLNLKYVKVLHFNMIGLSVNSKCQFLIKIIHTSLNQ